MCVRTIIDASAFRHLHASTRKSAGFQIRRWIERGQGVVVYSPSHTKYADELDGDGGVRALLRDYNQRGLAHDIDASPIQAALKQIPDRTVRRSNDAHVLALAIASEATVLFSCDSDLREDFGDQQIIGKVGQQPRSCVPCLLDELPEDTTRYRDREMFLAKRECPSC